VRRRVQDRGSHDREAGEHDRQDYREEITGLT
jgi:hypothetical protein